jgi:TonB family protein
MGAVKPNEEGLSTKPIPAFGDPQPKPLDNAADSATPSTRAPPLPSPKPAPPKQHVAAVQPPPKPSGSPTAHREETPQDAPRAARYAGSAASRDEYLAYLVTLTRQHMDLLPMSVIGSRHGETVISVVVYENGTIGPLSVVRSSGYPDIDQRIEQMVAAVRRFPPLPQWYQSNTVELELTMHWPEALEHPQ